MALKYFTNAYKGNSSDTIAINPDHVVAIFEAEYEQNKQIVTNIYVATNLVYSVEDKYLDVVARLNERD